MDKINVAALLIQKDNKILLVQEKGKAWGLWGLPMGHIEPAETPEKAVIREAFEETGYTVKITNKLGIKTVSSEIYKGGIKDVGKKIVIYLFEGKIIEGDLKPDYKDMLDANWFNKEDITELSFRMDWIKNFLLFNNERILKDK